MIHDLCIIMLTAGITSLLFKLCHQPVVLGYIVAGMLAGPHMCGESWIQHEESVSTWGDIGVLFLLFSLGLEFSMKKLYQVGSTAFIATSVIVVGMMLTGFGVGRLLGWDEMNSLFLGGMLCMSSTTIVFKAIEDLGLRGQQFVKVTFGILVVEDLFAVILMVLLSSVAVNNAFEGEQLVTEILKLGAYLVLWFVVGITLLPSLLRRFRNHLTDETLTIISIGLCLGMVLLATAAGFSAALGAFVMGSILAETIEAEKIEHLVLPVKNIFGSIFFVSVGMMIDPVQLSQFWMPILIITSVVVFGQIFYASVGTLLSGQSLKVSLQTGFTLVQIGEFAFILASLGRTLAVTDTNLYPIVVAVSVITTFLTPYIMRLAVPVHGFLDRHMRAGTRQFLEQYSSSRRILGEETKWGRYVKQILLTIIVNSVLAAFVFAMLITNLTPVMVDYLQHYIPEWGARLTALAVLLVSSSLFIYNIVAYNLFSDESRALWNSGSVHRASLAGIGLLRIIIGFAFVTYAIASQFNLTIGLVICLAVLFVSLLSFSQILRRQARLIEQHFNDNLMAREKSAEQNRGIGPQFANSLLNYDVHIEDFTVQPQSTFCGKNLAQLGIRGKTGVSIVRIVRGGVNINIPGGKRHVYPGDKIVVAGTDTQIEQFKQMLAASIRPVDTAVHTSDVTLEHFVIRPGNPLIGCTISESGIREAASCIVMGIERDGINIMNPDPQLRFFVDDIVFVAGEGEKIHKLFGN